MIGKIIASAIEHGILWALGAVSAGAASIKFALAAIN